MNSSWLKWTCRSEIRQVLLQHCPHTNASDAELWCFLWSVWINRWINNREAGYLRRHRAHYNVTVMVNDPSMHADDLFLASETPEGIPTHRRQYFSPIRKNVTFYPPNTLLGKQIKLFCYKYTDFQCWYSDVTHAYCLPGYTALWIYSLGHEGFNSTFND